VRAAYGLGIRGYSYRQVSELAFSGYVRLQQVASCMVRTTSGEGESERRRVAYQLNGVRFAEKKRADEWTRTADLISSYE
jgi:hypothetical protein